MSENQIVPALLGLSLGAMGVVTAVAMFWALPTAFPGGAGAAAGIALINCTGNLAGFVSPALIGWLKMQTHSVSSGLLLVALMLSLSAFLVQAFIPAKVVNRRRGWGGDYLSLSFRRAPSRAQILNAAARIR